MDNGLQRISKLEISSSSQHNSVITKSSYVDWASQPSLDIWTGPEAVQEESKCAQWSSTYLEAREIELCNSVLQKSSYVVWAQTPSPDIWTGPDTVQEESNCAECSLT